MLCVTMNREPRESGNFFVWFSWSLHTIDELNMCNIVWYDERVCTPQMNYDTKQNKKRIVTDIALSINYWFVFFLHLLLLLLLLRLLYRPLRLFNFMIKRNMCDVSVNLLQKNICKYHSNGRMLQHICSQFIYFGFSLVPFFLISHILRFRVIC